MGYRSVLLRTFVSKGRRMTLAVLVLFLPLLFVGCDDGGEQSITDGNTQVSEQGVELVPDNPTCEDLVDLGILPEGTYWEYKIDTGPPFSGTYWSNGVEFVVTTADEVTFDWSASAGVDAVISKGGDAAHVYLYDPEAMQGSGLHSPVNASGGPAAISHINFCLDWEVTVSKTAEGEFTRAYTWDVQKEADAASLYLASGQSYSLGYTVSVDAVADDYDHKVLGVVAVENETPLNAEIASITDIFEDIEIPLTCMLPGDVEAVFPLTLAPGEAVECAYMQYLADGAGGVNEAFVEMTPASEVNGGEAMAELVFGAPTTIIEPCVSVEDTMFGTLMAELCAEGSAELPLVLRQFYEVSFDSCGQDYDLLNIATLVSSSGGGVLSQDSALVNVTTAPCALGCTLTQGYWKTHSAYGPAPYDDTWDMLGEDDPFFLSGVSYYDLLWTPPTGGNAYISLAHQYIAAHLNGLNGAAMEGDALTAFNDATSFFSTALIDTSYKGKFGGVIRDQILDMAAVLADYNEGAIGPGHCDEATL